MNRRQIDGFLSILARELAVPARAFLTGAAAAALWGRVRPSADIDLGLELRQPRRQRGRDRAVGSRPLDSGDGWTIIQPAVDRTTQLTGIPASVPRSNSWSIGKLTRALDPDLRDVAEVFRRQEVSWIRAAGLWGRALRASPASTSQYQFRLHVEDFFRKRGKIIWGEKFLPAAAMRRFHSAARIAFG